MRSAPQSAKSCNIKNLLSKSNLKNVFHAICGDKEKMTGEDIKNFIYSLYIMSNFMINLNIDIIYYFNKIISS